jgi:hypothetical protein
LCLIHGHVSFWGQCAQPYFVDNNGKTTNEFIAKRIINANIHIEKLSLRDIPSATIGAIHRGTITGMFFLNFFMKRMSSFFFRSFAAI